MRRANAGQVSRCRVLRNAADDFDVTRTRHGYAAAGRPCAARSSRLARPAGVAFFADTVNAIEAGLSRSARPSGWASRAGRAR